MTQAIVVVAHDLTDYADAALDAALGLGVQPSQLHVVHVVPTVDRQPPGMIFPASDDEPRRHWARQALQAKLDGTPAQGATIHVAVGAPERHVVRMAEELGATWVIVATHGRTGVGRMILGSVAEHVARHAHCPVLIVHDQDKVELPQAADG
jgi:nucleotide-binding universal stress UspA family protein